MSTAITRTFIHRRDVVCLAYRRDDGLWDIEGTVTDRKPFAVRIEERGQLLADEAIHDITLRIAVDRTPRIIEVEVRVANTPYRVCPRIAGAYQQLVGVRIGPGFTATVKQLFRGVAGCTHLTELLGPMATTAFQALWDQVAPTDSSGSGKAMKRHGIGGCHALAKDGEVVRLYFSEPTDMPE